MRQNYFNSLQGADETYGHLPQRLRSEAGNNSVHGGNLQQQQLSSAGGQHIHGEAVRGSNAAAAALGLLQVCAQILFASLAGVPYMGLFVQACLAQTLLQSPDCMLYVKVCWQ